MSTSVLDMSMSLDGFITGPDDGPGNGLGIGGNRLHEWLGAPISELPHFDPPGVSGQVFAELVATGAVVVGRKTFDYAGHWGATTTACRSSYPRAALRRRRRAVGCTTYQTPRPRCARPRRPRARRT